MERSFVMVRDGEGFAEVDLLAQPRLSFPRKRESIASSAGFWRMDACLRRHDN